MAENVDYRENKYNDYSYNDFDDRDTLNELQYEKFSNPENYTRTDLYMWENFVTDLKERKIKIKRKLGWFYDSSKKEDLKYTFDLYKKKFHGTNYEGKYTSKNRDEKTFLEISKKFKYDEIISYEDFVQNRGLISYLLTKITKNNYYPFLDTFKNLLFHEKIDILKKPDKRGWLFNTRYSLEEDLKYTLDKYYAEFPKTFLKNSEDSNENPSVKKFSPIPSFQKTYPEIIDLYKNFMMEDDTQLKNLLNDLLKEKNLPENEAYDLLIEEARRKYNFENDRNNENIKNFASLSTGMKEKTKTEGKRLEKFLQQLKPLVKDYDARNKARDESIKSQISKKTHLEKIKYSKYTREETYDYIRRSIFLKKGTPFKEFLNANGDYEKI